MLHLTAVEFRRRYTGQRMLDHFREELVIPYLAVLRVFSPLTPPPGWLASQLPSDVM
jgi:hypothetical protein